MTIRKRFFVSLALLLCMLCSAMASGTAETSNLTFDEVVQQAAVEALSAYGKPNIPCVVVVMDMEGRIIAMADNQPDDIEQAAAIGGAPLQAIYPMLGLTALSIGELMPDEVINDDSPFDLFDLENPPRCWIAPERQYAHQQQTLPDALGNSCDYFFYTLAARIDEETWLGAAQDMGLDSPASLGLPDELGGLLACQETLYNPDLPMDEQTSLVATEVQAALVAHLRLQSDADGTVASDKAFAATAEALMQMAVSHSETEWVEAIRAIAREQLGFSEETVFRQAFMEPIYNQLGLIKWNGSKCIQAKAGRSFSQITPIAMARYWTMLGNGGRLYQATQLTDTEPKLTRDFSGTLGQYLSTVLTGMNGLNDRTGSSHPVFKDWALRDEVSVLISTPDAASDARPLTWVTALAPQEQPEISVVVFMDGDADPAAASEILIQLVDAYRLSRGR